MPKKGSYEFPGFAACVNMMRSRKAWIWEDGYQYLLPRAREYFAQLCALLETEESVELKSGILDLFVCGKVSQTFPVEAFSIFVNYFFVPEHRLADWAKRGIRGLRKFAGGKQILWDAYYASVGIAHLPFEEEVAIRQYIADVLADKA